MDNRIKLSKDSVIKILKIIKNKDKNCFRLIPRDLDINKNPRLFMINLGIDMSDLIYYIKDLKYEDYLECILDSKNKYVYLYVFKKQVNDRDTYIKLGFKYDDKTGNVYIVSFHEYK